MTILITGANRGIGWALHHGYAASGAHVIGTHRAAVSAGWISLDVTDPVAQSAMANELAETPIDLLICNAGVYLDKGFDTDDYTSDVWADTMAANVTGVFLTVQALLPNLRKSRGKIAIISSQMASDTHAPGGSYAYRASKAAVLNLGRNLAADLRSDGIAVGIYHPGWVVTDMGGPTAQITAQAAAAGLIDRFAALSLDTTGCFETWDGRPHDF